ncbi:TPA: YiiG family protein [Escherichia coli]|uniref:YiiG family protein n=3 Tax=Escherichia coli TaxID=562 RepID=UPI000B49214F|nr:YiiG family protein [Escherichia coli]MBV2232670.1 YiiG family protein [Escherichia coli]MBV2268575.1 YiiG family protein [Escherichia coli]MBV2274043.1 YiiG family protein [Escherichia coli]MBV2288152.1 YiiG family protein [Escherichia coli]MBV2294745.1 YiiG family protein [Escherichia coli]
MKRNLLSSAIIVAIMALGLTGCDDKKAETETPPPANSQPAAPAPEAKPAEAPVAKAEVKPETPAQPVVDEQAVFDEKMDVYIKCYNKLQIPVQRSLARYADWLKDFKQGPTGKESTVYGIYGISESSLAECEKGVKSAVALGNTINEMDKYYTQENYKDDAFAKGKTLHQTFLKNLEAFEPVAESYHAAIQEINDKRQLAELKNIEEREGKTFHYYSLAVMISAKQINNLISQEKFDVDAAMKKVSELETLVAQAKEADKGGMNFSFINSAGQYQLEAKKYVRRIRDKVPYSDWDKEQLQDANSSWMVEDSFPRALREYNEMVDDYNRLR